MVQYNEHKLLRTENKQGYAFKSISFGTRSLHPDLLPSQIEKHQNNVQCVYHLITSMFIISFSGNTEFTL